VICITNLLSLIIQMPVEVSFILLLPLDVIGGLIDVLNLEGLTMFLMVNPLKMTVEERMKLLEYKLNNHLREDVFEDSRGGVHSHFGETCECFEIPYNLINKKPCRKELKRVVKKYHDFYMGLFEGIFRMTNEKCQHQMIKMFFKPNLPIDHSAEELYAQMSKTNIAVLVHNLVLYEVFLYYATPNILPYLRILLQREFEKNIQERDDRDIIWVMGKYALGSTYAFLKKSSITDMKPEKYYHICYHLARYLWACNSLYMVNEVIRRCDDKYKILLQTPPESVYGRGLIQIDPNGYFKQIEHIVTKVSHILT
jgi:hypothetical protein